MLRNSGPARFAGDVTLGHHNIQHIVRYTATDLARLENYGGDAKLFIGAESCDFYGPSLYAPATSCGRHVSEGL